MRLIIQPDYQSVSLWAAHYVAAKIKAANPTSSPRSLSSTTTAKAGSCPTCRCNFSEPFRQAERNRARSNCRGEKWTKEIQPFRQAGCRAELVRAVPRQEKVYENKPNLKS